MNRIHITLVGGQPAPVYHGVVATKPDYVIYIYSTESEKHLCALMQEINIPSEQGNLDVTSPEKIRSCALSLAKRFSDDEVIVNITSGLKSWSHWFGVVFDKQPNASVVYIDQNNVLWNYRTMQPTIDFQFDMHVHFRLYGNSIENNYKSFSEYTPADDMSLQKIEEIRAYNTSVFNELVAILEEKNQRLLKSQSYGRFEHASGSFVEWEKPTSEKSGFVRIYITKNNKSKEVSFESPHAVNLTFNSGWFEYKVAKILKGWERSLEICLNCRFPHKKGVDKNEADIIINTGSKLLFVECKTKISKPTDIDKFRSVIRNYGGMGSKGIFITDVPLSELAKQKCEEHGILSFSLQDSHMGLPTEHALFLLLNTELYNINTK